MPHCSDCDVCPECSLPNEASQVGLALDILKSANELIETYHTIESIRLGFLKDQKDAVILLEKEINAVRECVKIRRRPRR
jgi:hypothetical protein